MHPLIALLTIGALIVMSAQAAALAMFSLMYFGGFTLGIDEHFSSGTLNAPPAAVAEVEPAVG